MSPELTSTPDGSRAQSDRIIERLEDTTGLKILAKGFPSELIDGEPEA